MAMESFFALLQYVTWLQHQTCGRRSFNTGRDFLEIEKLTYHEIIVLPAAEYLRQDRSCNNTLSKSGAKAILSSKASGKSASLKHTPCTESSATVLYCVVDQAYPPCLVLNLQQLCLAIYRPMFVEC